MSGTQFSQIGSSFIIHATIQDCLENVVNGVLVPILSLWVVVVIHSVGLDFFVLCDCLDSCHRTWLCLALSNEVLVEVRGTEDIICVSGFISS